MATTVTQRSSTFFPPINQSRKFHHANSYESRISSVSYRKRLLSEQTDCHISPVKYHDDDEIGKNKKAKKGNCVILMPTRGVNGRITGDCFRQYSGSFSFSPTYYIIPYHQCSFYYRPIGLFFHESKDKQRCHEMQDSSCFCFASERQCCSAPVLRRKSLSHTFTYIKDAVTTQTSIPFVLPSITSTTNFEKNMLICQQNSSVNVSNTETDPNNNSIYLTAPELAAFIINDISRNILVIDCGSPLRHTERRIQNSLLLNVNDKISRKRLLARGLKNFLDNNQLNRFNKSEIITLYDDSIRSPICRNTTIQSQLSSSMKCIYDEIKRYDTNKSIYVLQTTFDEFYQHYPTLCYLSKSTDEDFSSSASIEQVEPAEQHQIDFCQISEILPGLYLGNSCDAENLNILKQNQINTVINISTSIPCYFENEKLFEYIRLPCHDSTNQNILQYFETTFEYIHQLLTNQKNVLVHCQGGISRSPSFIIGYLMKYHEKTFDQAYQFVRTKRNIINPNLNFLGQLTQYQQMLNNVC